MSSLIVTSVSLSRFYHFIYFFLSIFQNQATLYIKSMIELLR